LPSLLLRSRARSLVPQDNLFEANTLTQLTYETIDSGGFYTSGQAGTAFTNRANVFRDNYISHVRNTAGTGFQVASNQGVYLDDQVAPPGSFP
jgi:hypothetical protein